MMQAETLSSIKEGGLMKTVAITVVLALILAVDIYDKLQNRRKHG